MPIIAATSPATTSIAPAGAASTASSAHAAPTPPSGADGRPAAAPPRRFWLDQADETPWLAPDKKLHFLASYGAFLSFRLAENRTGSAMASAAAVGIAKEFHDSFLRPAGPEQGASWHDLVADAAGIAAGVLVWETFSP